MNTRRLIETFLVNRVTNHASTVPNLYNLTTKYNFAVTCVMETSINVEVERLPPNIITLVNGWAHEQFTTKKQMMAFQIITEIVTKRSIMDSLKGVGRLRFGEIILDNFS